MEGVRLDADAGACCEDGLGGGKSSSRGPGDRPRLAPERDDATGRRTVDPDRPSRQGEGLREVTTIALAAATLRGGATPAGGEDRRDVAWFAEILRFATRPAADLNLG